MTLFTKNPLERLMMQRPYPGKEETPRTPAPEGHFCCGCSRYGTVCLRPCYRDTDLREKLRGESAGTLGPRHLPPSPADAQCTHERPDAAKKDVIRKRCLERP